VRGVIARAATTIGVLIAGSALACALSQVPPGGPPRKDPPDLLSITPDSNAVNIHPGHVVFTFDEVVSEGAAGSGSSGGGLGAFFIISPRTGVPNVAWHRDHISVAPHGGFRSNVVYTVTMQPGIRDLHGNTRKRGASITFSTGPSIPSTVIRGRIFDWLQGHAAARASIDALLRPTDPKDSLDYIAVADSTGAFAIPHVPPGQYTLRGYVDANNNHRVDPNEIWDSVTVHLDSARDSARVELLAFIHDTIGPRIKDLQIRDSVTLRLTFDRGVDTSQTISAALFTLTAKDSTPIPITRAISGTAFDSAQTAKDRAHADSIVRADSLRRADSGIVLHDTSATNRRRALRQARQDSIAHARIPHPSRPSPVQDAVLQLGKPLEPGENYKLHLAGLRGLLGASRASDRTIVVPKPPPKKTGADSARAKRKGKPSSGDAESQ
jgi:hypothetical protein